MTGMSALEVWLTIVGLTLVTIVTRGAFLLVGDRISLPERVQHALRYAPACALAALVAPELVMQQGQVFFSVENFKLVGAVVAGVVMLTTRNVLLTMGVGMVLFTVLRLA
jgi:branched-subunit amino acid transport protein